MLGQDDAPSLAIGCLELGGEIGRAPRRFSITAAQIEEIGPRSVPAPLPAPMPADAPRPPRAQPGVPHLRLVKS
ncbi:MAG: hypothetical protein MUC82_15030 [Cypionkella sp.]|nr:hypothetical protein [Cypionkella sp.]